MAARRGLGKGLSRASQSLSGLVDAYIKQALTEDSQIRQQSLMLDRQTQLAQLQAKLAAERDAFGDPDAVERALAGGRREVAGADISGFQRTAGQKMRPVLEDIGKGTTPQSAMTPEMLAAAAQAYGLSDRPSIESLQAARDSRSRAIQDELLNVENAKERLDPTTNTKGFRSRLGATFIPTERSAAEAGRFTKEEKLAGELDPAVAAAEATNAAGKETATTTARITAEDKNRDAIRRVALARHVTDPKVGAGAAQAQSLDVIIPEAMSMVEIAKRHNVGEGTGESTLSGIAKTFAGKVGDPRNLFGKGYDQAALDDFQQLESARQSFTGYFARIMKHVGTLTEQDEARVRAFLPRLGLSRTASDRQNKRFMDLLKRAQQLGASLPETNDPAEFSRRLNMLLGASPSAPAVTPENVVDANSLF